MAEKTFAVRVSFGNGHPIDDQIKAKSGLHAQDVARLKYPTARNVYITTSRVAHVRPLHPNVVQHELFNWANLEATKATAPDLGDLEKRTEHIQTCLKMRRDGLSHQVIATSLGVAKSTVGRWLKQYG